MRNRQDNQYDRSGSSQDFSNNEGFHNYRDYVDHTYKNSPQFYDRQKSKYDDGMSKSERNDYPSNSEYKSGFEQSPSDFGSASQQRNLDQWPRQTSRNYPSNYYDSQHSESDYPTRRALESQNNWRADQRQSFQGSQGIHTGKAPKGYQRSDERIKEDVCEALRMHGDIDASEIEVDVKDGIVTLAGTVESRQIKRLTEDSVEHMSGVVDVKNDLRVMQTPSGYARSHTSANEPSVFEASDARSATASRSQDLRQTSAASRQTSANSTTKSVQ